MPSLAALEIPAKFKEKRCKKATGRILSTGRLRRQDNNIYFDKFDDAGAVVASKILPINAIDEIYVLAKVQIDTYTMAFLADNNVLLHVFSPYQSFRGNFYPNTSNSVNTSGFVLLNQVRAFDDPIKRVYIAREITRAHILNDAANCKRHGVKFDVSPHIEALNAAAEVPVIMAVEGAFQKIYYEKWNEIIADQKSFKFTVRSKRPPADKINSFISYVNTRIYNVCLSEIYKTELDPRIGFLHEPNYRALSLHLDLAEIFKPILGDTLYGGDEAGHLFLHAWRLVFDYRGEHFDIRVAPDKTWPSEIDLSACLGSDESE